MPTISELRTSHAATVASIKTAVASSKMSAAAAQAADDMLTGLAALISADDHVAYRIEDATRAVRLAGGRDPTQLAQVEG